MGKVNLPDLLERELDGLRRNGRLAATTIFMSSATDPYQCWGRSLRLSRRSLEVISSCPPCRVLLQTRSPLIERDLDLLSELGHRVLVSITIETDDESVRRAFTPTSASAARRFATVQRLRSAGIRQQIAIAPMLPNDPGRFARMIAAATDRVVVDTYFAGDGALGRRSRALGMEQLYRQLGYEGWFEPGAEAHLLRQLRLQMGHDRVLFSAAGFQAV
jgi:DNA repair photolyase